MMAEAVQLRPHPSLQLAFYLSAERPLSSADVLSVARFADQACRRVLSIAVRLAVEDGSPEPRQPFRWRVAELRGVAPTYDELVSLSDSSILEKLRITPAHVMFCAALWAAGSPVGGAYEQSRVHSQLQSAASEYIFDRIDLVIEAIQQTRRFGGLSILEIQREEKDRLSDIVVVLGLSDRDVRKAEDLALAAQRARAARARRADAR